MTESPINTHRQSTTLDFLSGGGEMGRRIREFDWTTTPLGSPHTWPQSLKTCVRIMLTSPQPMFVWWGRDALINIYNDAYRFVLGNKHPEMLGRSGKEAWAEIWDDVWSRGKTVFDRNEGTFDEALLLLMKRYGYEEETYFKFSYNPVPGENGGTEGLFCVCTEETDKIIGERQLQTIQDLSNLEARHRSLEEVYKAAAVALERNARDFPFAVIYKTDHELQTATAIAYAGLVHDQKVLPDVKHLYKPGAGLDAFAEAFSSRQITITDHTDSKIKLPRGPWHTEPTQVIHIPISLAGNQYPHAIISAGINPVRQFDKSFRHFASLISDQIAIEVSNVIAYEEERKRAAALAEIDKAKTAFFTNISHEFRTPLTLMLGSLEQLLNDTTRKFEPDTREPLETSHRNAMRLLRLVNNLLDFSSIEAGKVNAYFELTDVCQFTADLASSFRSVIEHAGLKFNVECEAGVEHARIDRSMWEKIVMNLLSNAFKYTLQGSITLSVTTQDDNIVLKVKDTGTGIPPGELPKIFQRFHRVRNVAARTYEGTGIGLSLVKELVQLHNGQISVNSKVDEGSEFIVSIPATTSLQSTGVDQKENGATFIHEAFIEEAKSFLEPVISVLPERPEFRPTILVVDDNGDMRTFISNLLLKHYNVVTASEGTAALRVLETEKVDLVVSDIMMPVMDGIQLLKKIKENSRTANLPVVLLSARTGDEAKVEGFEIGADDYMVKPFSSRELLARVNSQISIAKKRNNALQSVYHLFEEVPFAVTILIGEELVIEYANQYTLSSWKRQSQDVLGKPLFEALPHTRETAEWIHQEVYKTRKRFSAVEIPVETETGGQAETRHFNIIVDPLFNEEKVVIGQVATAIDVTEQVQARKRIEENRFELHRIFSKSPSAIALLNGPEHVYTLVNKQYQRYVTRTEEQLLGKRLRDALPELADQGIYELFDSVYQTGKAFESHEVPVVINHAGELRTGYYNILLSPLTNDAGEVTDIIAHALDVTEQVVARKRVEQSEDRLSRIIQQINAGIASVDVRGKFIDVNDRYCAITGYKREELMRMNMADITHPEDLDRNMPAFKQCVEEGKNFFIEKRYIRPDGSFVWVNNSVSLIEGSNGEKFITAVSIDITRDKEARHKLMESESSLLREREKLGLALITGSFGVYEWGIGDEVVWWSPELYLLFGVDQQHFTPTIENFSALIHPEDRDEFWRKSAESIAEKAVFEHEYRMTRPDGQQRWIYNRSHVALSSDGVPERITGVAADITERKRSEEELRLSKERLQAALTASHTGTFRWNIQTNELSWDENLDRLFGLEPGKTVQNLSMFVERVHPDDQQGVIDRCLRCATEGVDFDMEFRVVWRDGSVHWVADKGKTIRDLNGKPLYMTGACADITELKDSQESLKYQKTLLETVTGNTNMALFLMDDKHRCIYMNEAAESMTGFTLAEVAGKELHYHLHPVRPDGRHYPLEECPIHHALDSATRITGEETFMHKKGSFYPVAFTASPIIVEGKTTGIVIEVRDTSEEKKKEQALVEREQRFRILAETLPQMIWVADSDGKVEYHSGQWADYSGINDPYASWNHMIHPDDYERAMASYQEAFTQGKSFRFELRLRNIKDVYRWHKSVAEPVKNERGEVIKWVGALSDIHDQKVMAEKLEKLVAERTLELKRSNEDLQQFAHVASHDLKEPVRKVKMFSARFMEEFGNALPEKGVNYINKIGIATERMSAMIDGVLMYSSVEAARQPFEKVDINDLIENIKTDLEILIDQQDARIHCEKLPTIIGSPILLYQLFYNLINNSLKFAKAGVPPRIMLRSENVTPDELEALDLNTDESYTRIIMSDNGIGFKQEDAKQIFQTFSRLNSKDKYEGTGLGLALCKKIAERHGGAIYAEGQVGVGAAIVVILPLNRTIKYL